MPLLGHLGIIPKDSTTETIEHNTSCCIIQSIKEMKPFVIFIKRWTIKNEVCIPSAIFSTCNENHGTFQKQMELESITLTEVNSDPERKEI